MDTDLSYIYMNSNKDDIGWCYEMLSEVSRTFEIPIKEIGSPEGDYTCVGYLLCRIPDTIEDTPHLSGDTKEHLLDRYRDVVRSADGSDAKEFEEEISDAKPDDPLDEEYWTLAEQTSRVFQVFSEFPDDIQQSITKYVDELTHGMEKFMSRHDGFVRIEDEEELEEYCYYVAGTVGHMLAEIDSEDPDEEFHQVAEDYGLLLQTVNVSKDVHGDYHEEDNIYIPAEFLQEKGVDQDNLLDDDNIEGTVEAVNKVIEYSRSKVSSAREYLKQIADENGHEHMRPWAIPYLLAVATLRELEDNTTQSLTEGGVKITRNEVANIIGRSQGLKPSEIKQFEEQIHRGELK